MISIKPVLDRLKKDGTGQVRIRCIYKGQVLYLTTGIYIQLDQWNPRANAGNPTWVKLSHPLAQQHNHALLSRIGRLIKFTQEAAEEGTFRLDDLKTMQAARWSLGRTIDEYIALEVDPESVNTVKMYNMLKSRCINFKGSDVAINKVDYVFVKGFQNWMTAKKLKSSSIHRGLSYLRTIMNFAVRVRQIKADQNPFLSMTLPGGSVNKERLEEHELNLILSYKYSGSNYLPFLAARTFALQFYLAGMRVGDVLQIRQENIEVGWLHYFMDKTGKFMPIPVPDPAKMILEELFDIEKDIERFRPGRFLLPWMDGNESCGRAEMLIKVQSATAQINANLKVVASQLGITKRLTSHMARHCFADLARKKSNDLYAISKALGHADLKTTQAYLNSFDTDEISNLMNSMFPKVMQIG